MSIVFPIPSHGLPFSYKRGMESKKDTIINFLLLTTAKPIYEAKFPRHFNLSVSFLKVLTVL